MLQCSAAFCYQKCLQARIKSNKIAHHHHSNKSYLKKLKTFDQVLK